LVQELDDGYQPVGRYPSINVVRITEKSARPGNGSDPQYYHEEITTLWLWMMVSIRSWRHLGQLQSGMLTITGQRFPSGIQQFRPATLIIRSQLVIRASFIKWLSATNGIRRLYLALDIGQTRSHDPVRSLLSLSRITSLTDLHLDLEGLGRRTDRVMR